MSTLDLMSQPRMSKGFSYSKWDTLEDSDEEGNGDVKQRSDQMERAWGEIARLQQIADGLFGKAEESKNMQEYQTAQKHYAEVLRLVKGALSAQRGPRLNNAHEPHRANKHIIACNLNSACCYLRAKNWTLAENYCTEVISAHLRMDPIEELRARHFRLYALSKQLEDTVSLLEEYQFKGIQVQDETAAKLSERVEVDCSWVDKLIVLNPQLNDDQYEVHVRDAVHLKDDARGLVARAKASSVPRGDDAVAAVNDEEDRKIIAEWEREQEQAQALVAQQKKGEAKEEKEEKEEKENAVLAAKKQEEENPVEMKIEKGRLEGVVEPSEGEALETIIDSLKWEKKALKKPAPAAEDVHEPESIPDISKPKAQSRKPTGPSVESLLQEAAKQYKKKQFESARKSYIAVVESTNKKNLPAVMTVEEEQAIPMMRSLGLAGEGSCLVGLKRHEEALPGLQSALEIFMDYVQRWIQAQTNALNNIHNIEVDKKLEMALEKTKSPPPTDEEGNLYQGRFVLQGVVWWIYDQPGKDGEGCLTYKRYFVNTEEENDEQNTQWDDPRGVLKEQQQKPAAGAMIPEEQILNVARHVWNTMDNIMECLASSKVWTVALKHCDQSLSMSESLLGWEKSMSKAKRASSADFKTFVTPVALQSTLHEANYRHSMSLLTKGHIINELRAAQDSPEGRQEIEEYFRMQHSDDSDEAELYEDCLYYWEEAARGFRNMKNFFKASETYGLIARSLSEAGSGLDKKGRLEPYMDWEENPRALNDDYIFRASVSFTQQGEDANRLLEIERARRGNFDEEGNLLGQSGPKAASEQPEKWELGREMDRLHKVVQSYFLAGIHSLHCKDNDSATSSIRSLEKAIHAYLLFIKTTPITQAVEAGTDEYRNFFSIIGDLFYHASLAYFRTGEIPYSYEMITDAIENFKLSEDRTRMQHALGLRSLILTLMDKKETAEADVLEAGKLALAPLESESDVIRQVRLYLSRYAPKALLSSAPPTPKMMALAPEDAARAATRKAEEEATLKKGLTASSSMRVEVNPEMYEKVQVQKSAWTRAVSFMTGDGVVNIAFGWTVVVMALVAIYLGFKKLKLAVEEANTMAADL